MSKKWKLIPEILKLSKDADWEQAKLEWAVSNIYEDGSGDTQCICGKEKIFYCCDVVNVHTNEMATLGCICTDHLFGLHTAKVVAGLVKIKKDFEKAPNDHIIGFALAKKIINEWEAGFLSDMQRKRSLSIKQEFKIAQINEKIILKMTKSVGKSEDVVAISSNVDSE